MRAAASRMRASLVHNGQETHCAAAAQVDGVQGAQGHSRVVGGHDGIRALKN